ncbi:MAG: divergent polysaccharide deacetylase family protein [bacterium]
MGRRKKRKRSDKGKPAGIILALAGFFLILGFLSITTSRLADKFHQGAEYAKSLFFSRGKGSPLIPPPPDILNEEEKRFFWAQEFDSALQTALSDLGLEGVTASGGEDSSSLPLKRVIELGDRGLWTKIRKTVLDLVQARGGKVFTSHEETISPSHRQMVFFLGSKDTNTASYILIFQSRILSEERHPAARRKQRARVALVIDDLGYNRQLARALFDLNLILNVSILPHHPFSRQCAQMAHDRSWEIILHLPMQPRQCALAYWEKNTLQVGMSKEEMLKILDSGLRDVPGARGVNNHMGSLMLEDRKSMQVILEELKSRGLYFLDSRTTPGSVGYEIAQALEVPSARRQVFLDNQKSVSSIRRQIDLLIDTALKDGQAVGIGHLHPATIQALRESASKFRDKGITLVRVSELVK